MAGLGALVAGPRVAVKSHGGDEQDPVGPSYCGL